MTAPERPAQARLVLLLILLGIAWGLQVPLTKIAVAGGYRDAGIVFWQSAIDVAILLPFAGRVAITRARIGVWLFIGLIGTLGPALALATAAVHLPGGIVALGSAFVPLMALPLAIALGTDRAEGRRVAGLALGMTGTLALVLPGAGAAPAHLLPLALIAPLFYAIEGNGVARFGMAGLTPVQAICGASAVSALIAGPVAAWRGDFISPLPPWGVAQGALVAGGVVSVLSYVPYLWLIGRAGAVFAAQVSYLVTGFGILWSMALLGERFPAGFWLAIAVILAGAALVQPRRPAAT